MNSKIIFSLSCIGLLMVTFTTSLAQLGNQGTLEGTVTDPSGAVVPQAKLTATNIATGVKFDTDSSSQGLYRFSVLPVGTYDLKVEKQGFNTGGKGCPHDGWR